MNRLNKPVTRLFFCLLLISCARQSPQIPSNKGIVADKNTASLLVINQNLAKKEDSVLRKFILQQNKAFKRSDIGFWYKIDHVGNGSGIKDSVKCKITYKLMSIKGKLLLNDENQVVIGKKQLVVGLEEGLKLMNKGDSATFIVPWYLAYGMKGNNPGVPPYTSIICKMKVSD